jgi:hypothetical protein
MDPMGNSWMLYFMEIPEKKTLDDLGVPPIVGNLQVNPDLIWLFPSKLGFK